MLQNWYVAKLTGVRNAYEAVKTVLSKFSPIYYQRICELNLNTILSERIDTNRYS